MIHSGNNTWSNLSGKPSNVFQYPGWGNWDANTIPENYSSFSYSNSCPWTGPLTHFSAGGYGLQLNANYGGGTGISYRTRNGDAGSWNSWYRLYSDTYRPYADSCGNADTVDGYHMNQAVTVNASPTFQEVYANGWFRSTGYSGHYNPTNGAHWYPNDNSYGTWKIQGSRNGWGGHVTNHNYILSLMLNTSGDYGFLTENGNWWNLFYNNGNNCWGIGTDNTYSGDGFRCIKYGSSQYGWTTWSDRRAKENIKGITNALDTVLSMRGVYFNYINDEAKNKRVGFIAQELEQVLPEAVRYAEEIDEYNVEYAQIVSVLTEAIKEQNAIILDQGTQINELKLLVNQLINK
jgi:hypothetical protein